MSKIYIDDVGEGYPLVLVHGYLGSSEMWCNQRNFFSNFCRVISPALPGFGESSDVQSLDSINKMAKFVIDIIDEKKIDKFNLLGHSMGGMIVQEITKIASNRVNKLICFATGSIGEIPGRFEPIDVTRQKLKLRANQCIAIEDSQESLNSAIRANIKCLIFPGEFHTSKKFKGALKKIKRVSRNIIE